MLPGRFTAQRRARWWRKRTHTISARSATAWVGRGLRHSCGAGYVTSCRLLPRPTEPTSSTPASLWVSDSWPSLCGLDQRRRIAYAWRVQVRARGTRHARAIASARTRRACAREETRRQTPKRTARGRRLANRDVSSAREKPKCGGRTACASKPSHQRSGHVPRTRVEFMPGAVRSFAIL